MIEQRRPMCGGTYYTEPEPRTFVVELPTGAYCVAVETYATDDFMGYRRWHKRSTLWIRTPEWCRLYPIDRLTIIAELIDG